MEIGDRIRKAREEKKISARELARRTHLSPSFISDIELNKTKPSMVSLELISQALEVKKSYLLGEEDSPFDSLPRQSARLDTADKLVIPVISMRTPACAGDGNGLDCLDLEAEEMYPVDRSLFREYDDSHRPFAVFVEGDSMEEQGIDDGDIAVINPAEEIMDGDVALVSYKGQWSIKGISYMRDGSIRLRAGKPQYERTISSEEAHDENWFRIIGKVVASQPRLSPPKRFV